MATRYVSLALLLYLSLLLKHPAVEGSWLQGASRPGDEGEFDVKDIEKRKLLKVKDELEAVEKELARRSEVEKLYEELQQVNLQNKKRQIRHTPVPEVKRLKMTPPPNIPGVPGPIVRYDKTPPIPANIKPRPTPLPYPYNLIDKPLRQTPRPLRLTPVPLVKPIGYPAELVRPVDLRSYEDELEEHKRNLWRQIYRRRLLARRGYAEHNRRGEDLGPYLSVGYIGHKASQERGGFYN